VFYYTADEGGILQCICPDVAHTVSVGLLPLLAEIQFFMLPENLIVNNGGEVRDLTEVR